MINIIYATAMPHLVCLLIFVEHGLVTTPPLLRTVLIGEKQVKSISAVEQTHLETVIALQ